MKNYFNFKNSNILILGASSGFGKLYSETFYDLGANVISVARNFSKLKMLKTNCEKKSRNGNIDIYKCDVNSNKSVDQLIRVLSLYFSQLDSLNPLHLEGLVLKDLTEAPVGLPPFSLYRDGRDVKILLDKFFVIKYYQNFFWFS